MKLIINSEGRCKGYGNKSLLKTGENRLVEADKSDLKDIVPSKYEGGWKENIAYFKIDDSGEIVFDESYEPKDGTGA